MTHRHTLQDFIEDELLRAPLCFDQAIDAVLEQWRRTLPTAAQRQADGPRSVMRHRAELVGAAMTALRNMVLQHQHGLNDKAGAAKPTARRQELSLIDEDEVSADIEIARAVALIKSEAEGELRAVQALTSALVDDLNVSRDTNPFRPEAYVRALWQGVGVMALSPAMKAVFMRDAAPTLARVLQQGYSAACARLDEKGVVPAKYRTIVPSVTSRVLAGQGRMLDDRLAELRDSMPMPLDDLPGPAEPTAAEAANQRPASPDPKLIELLHRLFEAMLAESSLAKPTAALLRRLHDVALNIARHDASMLEGYEHPVWRFMDLLAFTLETAATGDVVRCLAQCRKLVEGLASDSTANAAKFDGACARLIDLDHRLLEQAVRAAQPAIDRLQAAIDTASMPIDVGTLDTVPAELMLHDRPAPPVTPDWFILQPGLRLRAYLQGDWRNLQVLWCDPIDDHWLLRDIATDESLALRRRALDRLAAEELALPLQPRPLVRAAAERVMQSVAGPQVGKR